MVGARTVIPPDPSKPAAARCWRRWCVLLICATAAIASGGCRTVGYYAQAVAGHCHIWLHQRDIRDCLADSALDADLKSRLENVLRIRQFAHDTLRLPVDRDYQDYLDLGRPYVVWNVYAAPEFSLEAKSWWFPFVGRVKYRGYYSETGARRYAAYLRRKGYDVYVGGVQAYSTLGFFPDPVLNTFVYEPPASLAEVLFHELAHARLYVSGDSDFNEAFATAVAEEGVRRWLRHMGRTSAGRAYEQSLQREEAFTALVLGAVEALRKLYEQRDKLPAPVLRRRKAAQFEALRRRYAALKVRRHWSDALDAWFDASLNNAKLTTISTYRQYVPGFVALFRQTHKDWEAFYKAAARLGELPKAQRHRRLKELAAGLRQAG